MNPEPTIVINGQTLTEGQAMTARVALESFASDLHSRPNPLGDDEHGRRMTANYKRIIDEIRVAMRLHAPVPELLGTFPVTLYFGNDEDREEFMALMQQAEPGLVARKL
jgi:hypothetical protein